MTAPAGMPASSLGARFAARPTGGGHLVMTVVSAGVALLLCVVAVGRIGAQEDGAREMYLGHVALSELDALQERYEAVRASYRAYHLTDSLTRAALGIQLAEARAALREQIEVYADITRHADRVSTLSDDIAAWFAVAERRTPAGLDVGDRATATGPLVELQRAVTRDFAGLRAALREDADTLARAGADDAASSRLLLWALLGAGIGVWPLSAVLVPGRSGRTSSAVPVSVGAPVVDEPTDRPGSPAAEDTSSPAVARMGVAPSPAGGSTGVGTASSEATPAAAVAVAAPVLPGVGSTASRATPERRAVEVDGVVEVARSIAAQTYLLALDAAIEATRSGAAGRGGTPGATQTRRASEGVSGAGSGTGGVPPTADRQATVATATTRAVTDRGPTTSGESSRTSADARAGSPAPATDLRRPCATSRAQSARATAARMACESPSRPVQNGHRPI